MTGERVRPDGQRVQLPDGGPSAGTEREGSTDGDPVSADEGTVRADEAIQRICNRATDVRDAELDTALGKLEARGDLSETDREAVEDLADSLVEELLAVPVAALREADATAEVGASEDDTVETAIDLFG